MKILAVRIPSKPTCIEITKFHILTKLLWFLVMLGNEIMVTALCRAQWVY